MVCVCCCGGTHGSRSQSAATVCASLGKHAAVQHPVTPHPCVPWTAQLLPASAPCQDLWWACGCSVHVHECLVLHCHSHCMRPLTRRCCGNAAHVRDISFDPVPMPHGDGARLAGVWRPRTLPGDRVDVLRVQHRVQRGRLWKLQQGLPPSWWSVCSAPRGSGVVH